ncbi:MAG: YigZ family protein [Bacteroidales bacterium]|nr:YigZ family protein [Bacteroidales bacterium]
MTRSDKYQSIAGEASGLYKDSGSRFIAFAYPVDSTEKVKAIVDSLRREYHDARHCCYAYRIGCSGGIWRANDDGEPSGSAGRPILGQIDSAGLSDVLVVVVRYFGGVLLGIPGLIKAYRTSTADALSKAKRVTKYASSTFRVTFSWEQTDTVLKTVRDSGAEIISKSFDNQCVFTVSVRLSETDIFIGRLSSVEGNPIQVENIIQSK